MQVSEKYHEALAIATTLIEQECEPTSALKQAATECEIEDTKSFVCWGITEMISSAPELAESIVSEKDICLVVDDDKVWVSDGHKEVEFYRLTAEEQSKVYLQIKSLREKLKNFESYTGFVFE
jgi:hypothetical protein